MQNVVFSVPITDSVKRITIEIFELFVLLVLFVWYIIQYYTFILCSYKTKIVSSPRMGVWTEYKKIVKFIFLDKSLPV